jgi:hypothetical protein
MSVGNISSRKNSAPRNVAKIRIIGAYHEIWMNDQIRNAIPAPRPSSVIIVVASIYFKK